MKINENAEMPKADTKKAMFDTGNEMAHANADANADVEKIKADIDKKMADKQNG